MKATAFLLALSIAMLSTAALAEVPGLINYQGTLTDSNDVALDTTVSMTFSINTDSVGGTQVWSETQSAVTVSHGLFNVLLGRVNAIEDTVFKDAERWLGVQVGGDPELTPRQRIAAEGYALKAGHDGDWTIVGNNMYSAVPGSVGIGTSSPAYKLDVVGDLKTSGAVLVGANRLELDPGFVRGNLRFQANQLSLYGGTDGIALRDAGGTAKVTMLNDGKFGIGTTTPAYELDVVGDLKTSGAVLVGANRLELDPGFVRGNLRFQSNQLVLYGGTSGIALHDASLNPRVTMLDDGNVGIGTTTPAYKLEVAGDLKATGAVLVGDNRLELDPGFLRGNLRFKSNQLSFYGGTAGIALLNTSATIKVIMLDDGKLGIGTTTPGYRLQVGESGDGTQARANAWNLLSSRDYKEDISPFEPADYQQMLEKLRGTQVVRYRFSRDENRTEHIGVIAEEAPGEILSPDGKGVSLGDYSAFLLAAIKAQQEQIGTLEEEIKELRLKLQNQR
jgi:hypothetical protein